MFKKLPRQRSDCHGTLPLVLNLRTMEANDETISELRLDPSDVVSVQLPPIEMYDIKKQLAAGVPLKQVNSNLLSPSDPVSYQQMTQYVNSMIQKNTEPVEPTKE